MAGTKQGGLNAAQTNKAKHGKEFYARIGALGGKGYVHGVSPPKGFAANRELAALAGAKGGTNSRRGKANG